MEPIFGFALYFVACLVVSIIASKRGRSGIVFFIACLLAGLVVVVIVNNISGSGNAAIAAFFVPAVGFVVAVSSKTGEDLAVEKGAFGEHKKCPFCAESVRKEAIKCKHCGSDLKSSQNDRGDVKEL